MIERPAEQWERYEKPSTARENAEIFERFKVLPIAVQEIQHVHSSRYDEGILLDGESLLLKLERYWGRKRTP